MVEGIDTKSTLKYTPFMNDELVAFVKKSTELSNHNVITIRELKELPLILKDEGTVTRKLIKMQLESLGYTLDDFNVEMCFSDADSVKCFVENSEAVGILSDKTIRSEISRKSLKKLKIKGLEFNREFSFVERNQHGEGCPDQRFKSFTSSFFNSINLLKRK